ncbi:34 kDa antigenic family protein [Mycolicibacterium septicum DSM 44393]|uniref:34 kDa antigenic family protein n=1 Tax=Mycolicibacterium septicum DSM 44393 TaxID=1341646 RepID=A0A7X6RVY4_9MYCO|nr:DUF5336 domain-containing protein [Mycolicibacterium septicum]NKZ11828.1 34 kDa antigenic family protein [Mycolicibacterium septicum DSM 44393]
MVNSPSRNLSIAVVVLGLAGYCVSFGPSADGGGNDWHVRFAVLAGLAAAIGLLPKQTAIPWLTAILAAAGFLDALSNVLTSSGWVLTTIAVLNGLQTVAAVAALWLAPETPTANAAGGYEAYLDYYNQAVQQYYQQGAVAQPDASQRSGYGQAYAQSQATQQAPQYGDYADLLSPQQDYGRTAAAAPAQSGAAVAPPGRAGAGPATSRAAESADGAATPQAPWPPTSR